MSDNHPRECPAGTWHLSERGVIYAVHPDGQTHPIDSPPPPIIRSEVLADPAAALDRLGARWSPDFDAYASGQLPAHMVRCVLCGQAPCACRYCQVMHNPRPYTDPDAEWRPCGMRIDPATGECPRGHSAGTCTTCGDPLGTGRGIGCEECAEYLIESGDVDGPGNGQP